MASRSLGITAPRTKIQRYVMRFGKWARYATGRSYQHVDQGMGKAYRPRMLEGYFNDLTGKADWTGATGPYGVPVVRTDTAEAFPFAIVIFQWALGNWDCAILRKEAHRRDHLLSAARWAVDALDPCGGWRCWHELRRPTISSYSAMAQGQGLSVLARAATLDPQGPWRNTADRVYDFLMNSGTEGLTRMFDGITALEEYPGETMPSVLNGWMFALAGIVDYGILTGRRDVEERASTLAADLTKALPRFDTGYWSTYDLGGNLASPFYHQLHIAQLHAMETMFPSEKAAFGYYREKFQRYRASKINTGRAVIIKIWQKLGQSDVGEMA